MRLYIALELLHDNYGLQAVDTFCWTGGSAQQMIVKTTSDIECVTHGHLLLHRFVIFNDHLAQNTGRLTRIAKSITWSVRLETGVPNYGVAVTAIVRNRTLVTRNDKDFSGFPVKVLNPWSHG